MRESYFDYGAIERKLWEEKASLLRKLEKIDRGLENLRIYREQLKQFKLEPSPEDK